MFNGLQKLCRNWQCSWERNSGFFDLFIPGFWQENYKRNIRESCDGSGRILGEPNDSLMEDVELRSGGDGLRVYVLENNYPKIQNMLQWLAENSSIEMISLIKSEELFLELAEQEPPDFAFIRLGDDNISGISIGNRLNRMGGMTEIVYIAENAEYALTAYEAGAAGYLVDPVERSKLEKYLKKSPKKQNARE
jgi:hypothetical protein